MLEICMQLPSEMIFPWRSRASAHWKVAKLNAAGRSRTANPHTAMTLLAGLIMPVGCFKLPKCMS